MYSITGRLPVRLGVQIFNFNMSSLCQPSSQSNKNVCSMLVHGCRVCGQFAPYAKAGYSSLHGAGGLAAIDSPRPSLPHTEHP